MTGHSSGMASVRREGSTWPAERVPGRLDADQAYRPLESSFMQSFKHALLLGDSEASEADEYLNDDNEDLIHVSDSSNSKLSYPLMLFSEFPPVPSENIIRSLVDIFSTKVHPKMTLLQCIPIGSLLRASRPQYLTFAMASLGSVASGGDQSVTEALWWAANLLIVAILEVDNREARKVDLLNAWIMLETYGALSADTSIWHRTNMTHGYVDTAARRLCLSSSEVQEVDEGPNLDSSNRVNSSLAIPAFVLIDVLRSVHYGLPPTLARSEFLSHPTSINNDYDIIYSNIVFNSRLPPQNLGPDGAFLALVAILGDIHTLSTVFHPLGMMKQYQSEKDTNLNSKSGTAHFQNPYLPFSPENENRQVKRKLQIALDLWAQRFLAGVGKDTAALFYFCRMYLSLPSLLLLPVIAGYSPRSPKPGSLAPLQNRLAHSDLHDGSEALKNAWHILENVGQSADLTPVWFPIVLFHASLVVWLMISPQTESGPIGMHGSLRVLQLFKTELEQMKWPCCKIMAGVVQSLMAV